MLRNDALDDNMEENTSGMLVRVMMHVLLYDGPLHACMWMHAHVNV